MNRTLYIRYASPASTPATHGARGYGLDVPVVQPHVNSSGHWIIAGPEAAVLRHVNAALHANDLNDYAWA